MKCALKSPRECPDGSIRWYEGDTFQLVFEVSLSDENGGNIEVGATDQLVVTFRDKNGTPIHKFTETGSTTITMQFTKDISKKFKVGEYTYTTRFRGDYVKTIMKDNKVVVE